MGIIVPNLIIDATGVVVREAYVAIAQNGLYVVPDNGNFHITTSFNIWNSHQDRQLGKFPIETRTLTTTLTSLDAPYADMYAAVKLQFAQYHDMVEEMNKWHPPAELELELTS